MEICVNNVFLFFFLFFHIADFLNPNGRAIRSLLNKDTPGHCRCEGIKRRKQRNRRWRMIDKLANNNIGHVNIDPLIIKIFHKTRSRNRCQALGLYYRNPAFVRGWGRNGGRRWGLYTGTVFCFGKMEMLSNTCPSIYGGYVGEAKMGCKRGHWGHP